MKIHPIIAPLFVGTIFGTILLLQGCGNDSEAPSDGSISFSPASITAAITVTGCDGADAVQPVTIKVYDADSNPLGNVDIRLTLDWAGNTSTGPEVLELYDDINENEMVDAGEKVSNATDPILYDTQTNSSGYKMVIIKYDTDCTYKGSLGVFSGTLYNNFEVSITVSS